MEVVQGSSEASGVFQGAGSVVIDLPEGERGDLGNIGRWLLIKKGLKLLDEVIPLLGQRLAKGGALQVEVFRLGRGVLLVETLEPKQQRPQGDK